MPTAMTFAFAGWTAIDGSFCCSTSVGGVADPKGSVVMMSWVVTRVSEPAVAADATATSTATESAASPEIETRWVDFHLSMEPPLLDESLFWLTRFRGDRIA